VVTGQDLAEGLIQTAQRLAVDDGIDVTFEVGDCEQLPYPDGSFDVISSAQGAVFAPDHRAVARELKRVSTPGGRVGLAAWRPGGAIGSFFRTMAAFQPPPPEGAGMPLESGRPEYVQELLGDVFELEFHEGQSPQLADSPEAMWDLFMTAFGRSKRWRNPWTANDATRSTTRSSGSTRTIDSGTTAFPRRVSTWSSLATGAIERRFRQRCSAATTSNSTSQRLPLNCTDRN
jgi:SAM-dependent methyltransferase